VRARLAAELARAAELEQMGRWDEALHLDEAIARDYARWSEAREAVTRAAALRASQVMARYEAQARRLAERDARQGTDLLKVLSWARSQRDPPAVPTLRRKLRVAELQRTAEHGDSLEAASARRLLARIFVFLSFYVPRADLAEGASARALRMFEAAVTIAPIRGDGCALLREALVAATEEQRVRLGGQCAPAQD
jgi:hypothetical protein